MWIVSIISFIFALPYADFLLPSNGFISFLGLVNIFIVIGVPILSIVLRGVRFLFRRRVLTPRWQAGMWSLWTVNIISLFAVASFTGRQFSEGEQESQSIAIEIDQGDTLRLELLDNISDGAMIHLGDVRLSGQQLHSGQVDLSIERSKNGKFELEQRQYSRGKDLEEAALLANKINYQIDQQGNTLSLPRGFIIEKGGKWRGQNVDLVLPRSRWKIHPAGSGHQLDPAYSRCTRKGDQSLASSRPGVDHGTGRFDLQRMPGK